MLTLHFVAGLQSEETHFNNAKLLLCRLIRGQPAYMEARVRTQNDCLDAVVSIKDGRMLCLQDMSNEVKYCLSRALPKFELWTARPSF